MAHCPEPIVIKIVGIEEGSRGQKFEEHNVCGCVVDKDVVVCLQKGQVLINEIEETGIAGLTTTTMMMT